jgi:hypothetical protein
MVGPLGVLLLVFKLYNRRKEGEKARVYLTSKH